MGYEQFTTPTNSTQFVQGQQAILAGTASIYYLLNKIATWAIIFSVLIMAGVIAWAKRDVDARTEQKKRIVRIIVIALIIFGIIDIFSLIQIVSEDLINRRI